MVPSGSCATMMRLHWPELFAGTPSESEARSASERVVELATYLDAHPPASPPERSADVAGAIVVHDSCHALRELGVKEQPRRLLAAAGAEVVETEGAERCCGFGGTFCVKLPAVSVAMADDKLDEWSAAGVGTVVGGDLSCLVHLEGRARWGSVRLRFRHLAEVLSPPPLPAGRRS